jgi:L-ribulose-5-phosphate 4-epimerase
MKKSGDRQGRKRFQRMPASAISRRPEPSGFFLLLHRYKPRARSNVAPVAVSWPQSVRCANHSEKRSEGRLTVSEINDLKKKLAMSSRMLFNSGLVDYSGHISARVPGSNHLLILPHPVSRATVVADDMVVTDFEGKLIEGKYKAPSEIYMHARAYKARSDIQSVAHLHNHMVAVLSMVDKPFFPASSNPGAFFGPGPLPVYMDPALIHTIEQGDAVARSLGNGDAVILRGHGSMVVGQAIEWVFAACVDLEEAASRFYKASLLGPVRVYNEDETRRVMAGRRKGSVVQKIWDHNLAKTKLAGLMEGVG